VVLVPPGDYLVSRNGTRPLNPDTVRTRCYTAVKEARLDQPDNEAVG
jgi:hypothetical protein